MRIIETAKDLAEGIAALARIDPRLEPVIAAAGEVPLRRRAADLAGLANIVVAQQVSVASASAIWGRVEALIDPFTTATLHRLSDADLAGAGLSRAKIRTFRAIAEAIDGGLDLARLAGRPAAEAHDRLTAISGIGPWTADIYLLFCAGHPDIFPSGDVALQTAVAKAFGLAERPKAKVLDGVAEVWAPWRSVAARVFWAYYRACAGRETLPV